MLRSFGILVLLLGVSFSCAQNYDWSPVNDVLTGGLSNQVYPGCVAMVEYNHEIVYAQAFGSFTYGEPAPVTGTNPPMDVNTSVFDVASLSKVTMATTAVMQMYQRGEVDLDWLVCDSRLLGPVFDNNGKGGITLRNLMLHNAGFPPDPDPGFSLPEFGCPQTSNYHPAEDFTCRDKVYNAIMQQTLQYPTGSQYVYSDLSFMTVMYIVGKVAEAEKHVSPSELRTECVKGSTEESDSIFQCYYEAYINKYVLAPLPVTMGFLPAESGWAYLPPTWNDTTYRHEMLQGVVNDENAYAMGGVSGHAGLFAITPDVMTLMHKLSTGGPYDQYVNSTTLKTFTTVENITQSSRALGWDTNNYQVHTNPNTRQCGSLDSTTYMHTGWTGTQICSDPVNNVITTLFTTRVYPNRQDNGIGPVRTNFNDAVVQVLFG